MSTMKQSTNRAMEPAGLGAVLVSGDWTQVDRLLRELAPRWLRARGWEMAAETLEQLPRITDRTTLGSCRRELRFVRDRMQRRNGTDTDPDGVANFVEMLMRVAMDYPTTERGIQRASRILSLAAQGAKHRMAARASHSPVR